MIEQTTLAMINPLIVLWNSFVNAIPGIIGALIIIIIGYFVAWFIGHIIHKLLSKTSVDKWMHDNKITHAIGKVDFSACVGTIVKWWVFIVFLAPAASILRMGAISTLLQELAAWLPQLLVAVIIVLFGLIAGGFAREKILKAKLKGIKLTASIVEIFIWILTGTIALETIGIKVSIIENILLILIGSLALGFGLAIGIGFGLGLKPEATQTIKKLKKHF